MDLADFSYLSATNALCLATVGGLVKLLNLLGKDVLAHYLCCNDLYCRKGNALRWTLTASDKLCTLTNLLLSVFTLILSSAHATGSSVSDDLVVVVRGLNERAFVNLFRLVVTRKGLRVKRCA